MMRWMTAAALALSLSPAACRARVKEPPPPDATDIPREVAVEQLRRLLPTCESLYCAAPSATLNPTKVTEWAIGDAELAFKDKSDTYRLAYADITQVQLYKVGTKTFYARVFILGKSKEHMYFRWLTEEPAKQAVELLEAVRPKTP